MGIQRQARLGLFFYFIFFLTIFRQHFSSVVKLELVLAFKTPSSERPHPSQHHPCFTILRDCTRCSMYSFAATIPSSSSNKHPIGPLLSSTAVSAPTSRRALSCTRLRLNRESLLNALLYSNRLRLWADGMVPSPRSKLPHWESPSVQFDSWLCEVVSRLVMRSGPVRGSHNGSIQDTQIQVQRPAAR